MNAALVLGLVVGAHASAVELTKSNFDELVLNSGRARSSSSSRLGEGTASR